MIFQERIKSARQAAGLTQKELGALINVTERTIQNYENGNRRPQKMEIVEKLASALHITTEALLDGRDILVIEAQEKGGARSARDIEKMVSDISAMFAGGSLSDEQKDGVMAALNRAYWDSKTSNKKYTPKKYRE